MTQSSRNRPPYPRLGELYRALAGALDTKARDRAVDRLAREGEYDWSLLTTLRQELITSPLGDATDKDFAGFVGQCVDQMHTNYLGLVASAPLDSLSWDESLPLLVEHYFALLGAGLLLRIKQRFEGPDLMALVDPERHPMAVVLDWFDKNEGRELARAAFPDTTGTDMSDRELISRWTTGVQIPDLQSIKRFATAVSKSAIEKAQLPNLRRWMVVARALAWMEKQSPLPVRIFVRRYLLLGVPEIDIGRLLSDANIKVGDRFSALKMPALMLYEDLQRTTPKALGDRERTWNSLDAFQRLTQVHDPEGRTKFHINWLLGRWHALSGQFDDALPHYKEAVELALYRAGSQQKQIVEETLVLAAFVGGDKPLLKRLKNWAVAFDLFVAPRGDDVIEDWEIDNLRGQFQRIFPRQGRFPEASDVDRGHEHLPFLIINKEDFASIEPDLRNPDRVRTIHMQDGQLRRWPQLNIFASQGRFDAVRALLEHGASVDQLDHAGGSALLRAIQHAQDQGNRQALDQLLERSHEKATLDSATTRKRHTPLICAVEYGEPDVVERLLAMGATVDRRGQVDDVTPLYHCMVSLGKLRNPARYHQHLRQSLLATPDSAQREMLRRYNIDPSGVFGDDGALHALMEPPRHREIFENLVRAFVDEQLGHISEPKLLRIVENLLIYGADPNAKHQYPVPGRTPLMLAAEIDSVEAFALMMKHGGNPDQQDAKGLDCIRIAIGFGSKNIVNCLHSLR